MSEYWRSRVIAQVEDGDSLEQIDGELSLVHSLSGEEHAWLWLLAWAEQKREGHTPDWSGLAPVKTRCPR